eukprot:TRINITY_DN33299_c0_g2_i1.p1 TRINITY_DN33299_c0_g2~~TRINITY_DN33299_c0_g2_i1.p1  ORF type:complete len:316 (-),score=52.96 TRINITY_DN33299_c0_g2_i1:29-976(-)
MQLASMCSDQRCYALIGFLSVLSRATCLEAARIGIDEDQSDHQLQATLSLTGRTDVPSAFDFLAEYTNGLDDLDVMAALSQAASQARDASGVIYKSLVFGSKPGSATRRALDFCMVTYLKVYGTRYSRLMYAGALSQRWVLEHPKTAGVAATLFAGAALTKYWYRVRARSDAAKREEALAKKLITEVSEESWEDVRKSLQDLDESGAIDRLALVAAQAELLVAGLAGRCEVFRMHKRGSSNRLVSKSDFIRWLSVDTQKAFRKYPNLAPISARCNVVQAGEELPSRSSITVLLKWNSLPDLVEQLQHLQVLPSEA